MISIRELVEDHTFGIGRASIYRWLSPPKLSATKVKIRQIKLDGKELEKDVKQNLESKLSDRAKNLELIIQLYFML